MASSFIAKVGGLIAGRGRDEYKPVQLEEASESRASLDGRPGDRYKDTDTLDPESSVRLLSSSPELESGGDEKNVWPAEKKGLCVCCGVNLATPFMIISIVGLVAFAVGAYELLAWAFYEPPKGLELLPEFGTSLGCLSASYFYNNTKTLKLDAPMHPERFDHGVDIHGDAVGTVTLLSSSTQSTAIHYEVTLRSNDHALLQKSILKLPQGDAIGNVLDSMVTISTPYIPKESVGVCIRYDVKVYIPPSLKKLHVASHSLAHIKFDKHAKIRLEDLFVTLFSRDSNNIIQATTSVKADRMSLEVTRGWIVGDVSVVDETDITTQRGDGVVHVDVYPEAPKDKENPEAVSLQTTTGAGKTQVWYHKNKGAKRPIDAMHLSSQNGPMEITYKGADINGLVDMEAENYETTGLESLGNTKTEEWNKQWTHFVGNKDGKDKILVSTRGWVGLYF